MILKTSTFFYLFLLFFERINYVSLFGNLVHFLLYRRATSAQTSIRMRTVSSEPSLIAYLKYGNTLEYRLRLKIRFLSTLGSYLHV